MLEKDIESAVCDYAKQTYDMLARKYTSPNHRSVPDRLFLGHGDHHFFIEFKRPGEKPTGNQEREIERLKKRGHRVYVIDDIEQGKEVIDTEVRASRAINQILIAYRDTVIAQANAPRVITPGSSGNIPRS